MPPVVAAQLIASRSQQSRLQNRPRGANERLFTPNAHVSPDQKVKKLPLRLRGNESQNERVPCWAL